jgi:hypothetical protein
VPARSAGSICSSTRSSLEIGEFRRRAQSVYSNFEVLYLVFEHEFEMAAAELPRGDDDPRPILHRHIIQSVEIAEAAILSRDKFTPPFPRWKIGVAAIHRKTRFVAPKVGGQVANQKRRTSGMRAEPDIKNRSNRNI